MHRVMMVLGVIEGSFVSLLESGRGEDKLRSGQTDSLHHRATSHRATERAVYVAFRSSHPKQKTEKELLLALLTEYVTLTLCGHTRCVLHTWPDHRKNVHVKYLSNPAYRFILPSFHI